MSAATSTSSSISWRVYDEEYKLSHVLTEAARACVSARVANPCEFLLSYFAQVTRGDSVEQLSCVPVLSPLEPSRVGSTKNPRARVMTADVGQGLRVAVRLFTNAEASVAVMHLPFVATPTDAALSEDPSTPLPELDGAAVTAAVMELASGQLVESLRQVGVYAQYHWDSIISQQQLSFVAKGPPASSRAPSPLLPASSSVHPSRNGSPVLTGANGNSTLAGPGTSGNDADTGEDELTVPCTIPLPTSARFAFSLSACLTAAKSLRRPLYRHIQAVSQGLVTTTEDGEVMLDIHHPSLAGVTLNGDGDALDSTSVTLPQLLIPFFGAASNQPPSGCVYIHTVYVLPCPGPTGGLAETLVQKLVEAYRVLRDRQSRPPLRGDGAVVMDGFENVTDAVQTAADVLGSVGIVVGEEVFLGVRMRPPVVTLGAAALATASGTSTAPASAHPESANGAAQGRKGAAGSATGGASKRAAGGSGGTKQAVANPLDFLYNPFAGDPDVTGQQLAEYLRQQVLECEGMLVLLQDTHHAADQAGLARLQRGLRPLKCSTCGESTAEVSAVARDAVVVDLLSQGTITELAATCGKHLRQGSGVVLSANPQELEPLTAAVDVAMGVGATYCSFGALTAPATCAALSYFQDIQVALQAKRCLTLRPMPAGAAAATDAAGEGQADNEEAALEEEEPIPEIKRKSDKKRKKGK